jgi:hypothetical protein
VPGGVTAVTSTVPIPEGLVAVICVSQTTVIEEIFFSLDDEVFGTGFLPHPLPKYRLPKHETDPTAAYKLVHDELLLDATRGRTSPLLSNLGRT